MRRNSFDLSEKEKDILTALYRFRLMTVYHLIKLTGRKQQNLNSSLRKLEKRGSVCRRQNKKFEPFVYSVGVEAAPILASLGLGDREEIHLLARRLHELRTLFDRHFLMVTDIHLTLELACRNSSIKIHEWREGKQLNDFVIIREGNENKKLFVRPDAFFSLDFSTPTSTTRRYFFLEADRGTTTNKTFQNKIKAYWAYYKQDLFTKKYNVSARSFRVITITESEKRAENLCKASKEVLPKGSGNFYYFTPMSNLSDDEPTNIFQSIFTAPPDYETKKRYSLIPPLATSKPKS